LRESLARYRSSGLRSEYSELAQRPLLDLLGRLLPLESPYTRRLLVGTPAGWTAIFDNSRSGGDPWLPASQLVADDT
jgi:hypothetical protein